MGLHDDELVEKVAEALFWVAQASPPDLASKSEIAMYHEDARAAIAVVRGAGVSALDDSLASARGFSDEQIERAARALRETLQDDEDRTFPPFEEYRDDWIRQVSDVLAAAVEPGPPRAASSNPPPSGAAPKGEQEDVDESSASWQNGYNVGFEHAKVASPPPDRLTPEDIESEELWRALMDQIGVQHADAAVKVLRARLADREPTG